VADPLRPHPRGGDAEVIVRAWFAGIVLLWVLQLAMDFFSNFLGGGLTIMGDVLLGGMQLYLAYRIAMVALGRSRAA
jgi:hypothetical protein